MFEEQSSLPFSAPCSGVDRQVLYPNLKARRDAIKAAGGPEYEALLIREREQRRIYRSRHKLKIRLDGKKHRKPLKSSLVSRAKQRARKTGLAATIKTSDLTWPTHCPILGIELDYSTPRGQRRPHSPNLPSLDRWDNTKGYVPGNVFVISMRANSLKSNATYEEMLRITRYMAKKP